MNLPLNTSETLFSKKYTSAEPGRERTQESANKKSVTLNIPHEQ